MPINVGGKIHRMASNSRCCCTIARNVPKALPCGPCLCCKTLLFRSGRCWVRTSDLCRVNAKRRFRRCSLPFRKPRKRRCSGIRTAADVHRCSCGLVYYWCKLVPTTSCVDIAKVARTLRIWSPEQRGAQHEPRFFECVPSQDGALGSNASAPTNSAVCASSSIHGRFPVV